MPVEESTRTYDGQYTVVTKSSTRTTSEVVKMTSMTSSVSRSYSSGPNYHTRISRGLHPGMFPIITRVTKNLWPTGSTVTISGSTATTRSGNLGTGDGRTIPTGSAFTSAEKAILDDKVRTKVRLAIKDQKINFGVAAAEWQKTADLVTSTATAIYNAYRSIRRGDIAGAARGLGITVPKRARRRFNRSYARNQQDAAASGWLELQYGWKPLLSDVYGAAELAAQQTVPRVRTRISRSLRLLAPSAASRREFTWSSVTGPMVELTSRSGYMEIKYVVYFEISGSLTSTAGQAGLTNPALIAWELVPFSFVVDWFLPIGDALSSLDATMGLGFEMGCATVFEKTRVQLDRTANNKNYTENSVRGSERVAMERVVLTDFPRPALPRLKNPVSVSHALSALALLNNFRK